MAVKLVNPVPYIVVVHGDDSATSVTFDLFQQIKNDPWTQKLPIDVENVTTNGSAAITSSSLSGTEVTVNFNAVLPSASQVTLTVFLDFPTS